VTRARISIDSVEKRFAAVEVLRSVSLDVTAHETVALLGPSGCGKTTLLRSIAGLERIDRGQISVDDVVMSGPGVHLRAEHRHIGMVFQDWALFPHLTVAENVAYGLPKSERHGSRVAEALALVDLQQLGDRSPSMLSGGQQQRVALARALAPRPQAILLDEPFSNLDTTLRVQVRSEVHHLLAELGVTTVFVTHDQDEAFVLGSRVAVMHDGAVEQFADPTTIYDAPATRWVAEFVGEANLISASASGDRADSVLGTLPLRSPVHGSVEVLLRPEQLTIAAGDDLTADGAPGVIELVEFYGHDHVSVIRLDDGTLLRSRRPGTPVVSRGQRVRVGSTGVAAVAFEAD
jgi:iron(III) transport system ATP-binding protein